MPEKSYKGEFTDYFAALTLPNSWKKFKTLYKKYRSAV